MIHEVDGMLYQFLLPTGRCPGPAWHQQRSSNRFPATTAVASAATAVASAATAVASTTAATANARRSSGERANGRHERPLTNARGTWLRLSGFEVERIFEDNSFINNIF